MTDVRCDWCPRHCILGTLAVIMPAESKTPVAGTPPDREPVADIRQYCQNEHL